MYTDPTNPGRQVREMDPVQHGAAVPEKSSPDGYVRYTDRFGGETAPLPRWPLDEPTTFRKLLTSQLRLIVNAQELDAKFVQMEYVEKKSDVLGGLLDYYTDELLDFAPFAKEFEPEEIAAMRDFMTFLGADGWPGTTTWPEIQARAARLHGVLLLGAKAGGDAEATH